MLQIIEGKSIYVVDFDTMPQLPITGLTEEETIYQNMLSMARGFINANFDPDYPKTGEYAKILTEAIETGIITEPGKYGIYIDREAQKWEVNKITEE